MEQQAPLLHLAAPLNWTALRAEPDAMQRSRLSDSNSHVLQLYMLLGDQAGETPGEEADTAKLELQRLETKVDYLVDLVSRVAIQHLPLPPATTVQLGGGRVQWQAGAAVPAIGSLVRIDLFLPPIITQALQLVASIDSVTPDAAGAVVVGRLQLGGGSDADLLDKIIFRCHRREVARRRQS